MGVAMPRVWNILFAHRPARAEGGWMASSLASAGPGAIEGVDPLEQIALAEAADASLLRLVACTAVATLVLALATSLV